MYAGIMDVQDLLTTQARSINDALRIDDWGRLHRVCDCVSFTRAYPIGGSWRIENWFATSDCRWLLRGFWDDARFMDDLWISLDLWNIHSGFVDDLYRIHGWLMQNLCMSIVWIMYARFVDDSCGIDGYHTQGLTHYLLIIYTVYRIHWWLMRDSRMWTICGWLAMCANDLCLACAGFGWLL